MCRSEVRHRAARARDGAVACTLPRRTFENTPGRGSLACGPSAVFSATFGVASTGIQTSDTVGSLPEKQF